MRRGSGFRSLGKTNPNWSLSPFSDAKGAKR
jgi:hypothetical protein